MKSAIHYTLLSVVNLAAFAILVSLLPDVPVQFEGGAVSAIGSAWVFVCFPAVTVLLSLGIWAAALSGKLKHRVPVLGILCGVGILLAVLGWVYLGLAYSKAGIGEEVPFPYAAVTALPLSLGMAVYGSVLSEGKGLRGKSPEARRLSGIVFLVSGTLSAAVAAAFTCLSCSPRLDWVALIYFAVALSAAVPAVWLCVRHFSGEKK